MRVHARARAHTQTHTHTFTIYFEGWDSVVGIGWTVRGSNPYGGEIFRLRSIDMGNVLTNMAEEWFC